jgi:4-hydroxy-3-methylbut-2-enyl diphosphate reductase
MGQSGTGMYLVETEDDVARLEVTRPATARLRDPDHALDRRRRAHRRGAEGALPAIVGPKKDDICYATQNRQDAVKIMAPQCDVVIVVGSPNSSNSNRLREVARNLGRDAYLVDNGRRAPPEWIEGKRSIGVTAGASAPEVLVHDVILRLQDMGVAAVRELEASREGHFPLPKGIDA